MIQRLLNSKIFLRSEQRSGDRDIMNVLETKEYQERLSNMSKDELLEEDEFVRRKQRELKIQVEECGTRLNMIYKTLFPD